jgi:teichuronic acid exporter
MGTQTEAAGPATSNPGAPPLGHRHLAGKAVRGGAVLMGARLLMQLFAWSVTIFVARLLQPSDYGVMTGGMIFLGLADLLAEAGIGKALVQKHDLHPADVSRAFTFSLLLSVGLYALLFAGADLAGTFLAIPQFGPFLRVLGLLVLLMPFRTVALALLDRDLRLGRQALVHVVSSVVQAGLVLGLALAGAGYWALTAGALAARFLEVIALSHAAGWRPRLAWPFASGEEALEGTRTHTPGAGKLLLFGLSVSGGSFLWFVYSNSDFAVVGRLCGAVELGIYALAFQLISLPVQKMAANTNQVAYAVFCRLQHDPERLRDWFLRLTVLHGFIGMPALVGLALVAPDAFGLGLGERWLPAVLPFQLLAAVGVLMLYSSSLPPLFNALGRPGINLRFTAGCAVLFPIAFVLGGLVGGVVGVCVAWLMLYPVMVVILLVSTRRLTGIGPVALARAQLPVVGAVLVMTGVVLLVRTVLAETSWPWLRLGTSIGAGVVAYAGVMLLLARHTVLADLLRLWRELRGGRPQPCEAP